jgi:hypothetical protein
MISRSRKPMVFNAAPAFPVLIRWRESARNPAWEQVMQTAQHRPAFTFSLSQTALTPADQAHRRRCKSLPPVQPGEVERLKADFLTTRGVTACPARYAAPIEQQPLLARNRY